MTDPKKTYMIFLLTGLVIAFLVGPPVAFATRLPTACNIFQEKKAAKLGTCGPQVTFSKDKFHSGEMVFSTGTDSGSNETTLVQNNNFSIFSRFVTIPNSAPLRC